MRHGIVKNVNQLWDTVTVVGTINLMLMEVAYQKLRMILTRHVVKKRAAQLFSRVVRNGFAFT